MEIAFLHLYLRQEGPEAYLDPENLRNLNLVLSNLSATGGNFKPNRDISHSVSEETLEDGVNLFMLKGYRFYKYQLVADSNIKRESQNMTALYANTLSSCGVESSVQR